MSPKKEQEDHHSTSDGNLSVPESHLFASLADRLRQFRPFYMSELYESLRGPSQ
jgi:hypothetical protein